ncbi:MAG: hypothetical protein OHK0052_25090 [Anaerolineales bacterium]
MPENRTSFRINLQLTLGAAISLLFVLAAFVGPQIAPRDPLEEHLILRVEDGWVIPPFPAFTVPGYPLGGDVFGRDLYSRLLWAIRPTLILVSIVAGLRLLLGLFIGLLAGWYSAPHPIGRILDMLINFALSIPVLLVALGAIAIVGPEMGLSAFIFGLCLTGWVETAQQVREQTRILRTQAYIEAARALGASARSILLGHILRQLLPLLLILLAFEISSALMTTAGLGFLGYYIGGDVWVDVSDFVARRMSGTPELGQMLATSWTNLTQPWPMVAVGTVVFFAIFGFNLLGEGLRQTLGTALPAHTPLTRGWERLWLNLRQAFYPFERYLRPLLVAFTAVALLFAGWRSLGDAARFWESAPPTAPALSQGDADGATEAAVTPGAVASPRSVTIPPEEIVWQLELPKGVQDWLMPAPDDTLIVFAAGAEFWRISPDGRLLLSATLPGALLTAGSSSFSEYTLYPVVLPDASLIGFTRPNTVYHLALDASLTWTETLQSAPYAPPLLAEDGTLYLTDRRARLYAFDTAGLKWVFTSAAAGDTASAPLVAPDGTVLYVVTNLSKGFVQAVSPAGEDLGWMEAKTQSFYSGLRLSADGRYVFLREDVFDLTAQARLDLAFPFAVNELLAGRDGNLYARSGYDVLQWRVGSDGSLETLNWVSLGLPPRQTITPWLQVSENSTLWLTVGNDLLWLTPAGESLGRIENARSGDLISADLARDRLLRCLAQPDDALLCEIFAPGSEQPIVTHQTVPLPPFRSAIWRGDGAYLFGRDGNLYWVRFYLP